MTAKELRKKYLDFFKEKGHSVIPSASLIPENDPTVLFTTAGMHPLVPYLMGEKHPEGNRLVDVQKCIRTSDIDEVGDNRHLTFFEMLGNWSLGDYFKREAIEWSWEFMTSKEWLNLDPNRIFVTVFMGDNNAPTDEESIKVWQEQFKKVGINAEICEYNKSIKGNSNYKIFPLPAKDNWWGPAGETGPCGPSSEMFYDTEPQKESMQKTFDEEVDSFRVMEIWNDVFMEYNKTKDGLFKKLKQRNVDTGMGLERTIAILNGKKNVFDSEIFYSLINKIEELSGKKYGESEEVTKAMRIIVDHIRAAYFIIIDGIHPSNLGPGYILRRLIRRAARYISLLKISDSIYFDLIIIVGDIYKDIYPNIKKMVGSVIISEIKQFNKTLEKGEKEFIKMSEFGKISGHDAFILFSTYGFPFELTQELAQEKNYTVDEKEFKQELEKHSELSKTASVGMFKGGLADASEETKKLHTAAHLLLAALRKVLGDHVIQKGSNITPERLRFDFSHNGKMTDEQKQEVETIVNKPIENKYQVNCEELSLEEAKKQNAISGFE